MPKETDRLKLPLPLGNENVTRESINGIFERLMLVWRHVNPSLYLRNLILIAILQKGNIIAQRMRQ